MTPHTPESPVGVAAREGSRGGRATPTGPTKGAENSGDHVQRAAQRAARYLADHGRVWIGAHPDGPLAKAGVKRLIGRTVHYNTFEFVNTADPSESRELGLNEIYLTTRSPY